VRTEAIKIEKEIAQSPIDEVNTLAGLVFCELSLNGERRRP